MKALSSSRASDVVALALALGITGCSQTRNLGSSSPHGLLPVDERNPIVLLNDGVYDNWQGEYALLLANSGGSRLAGIAVGTSPNLPEIKTNMEGWSLLVEKARASGLSDVPELTESPSAKLVQPSNGEIGATTPNGSGGAHLIVELSRELSLPYRPLVVVTGGRLTDVADAYLLDPTVAERTVVVSSLGTTTDTGAVMMAPNGEMDPWADFIVTQHFRFVQVSAFYDQLMDVPASRLSELPANPLGQWISDKQSKVWSLQKAADQVAVLAVNLPTFAVEVERVSAAATIAADANAGPELQTSPDGAAWLVRKCDGTKAAERLWQALAELPASPGP